MRRWWRWDFGHRLPLLDQSFYAPVPAIAGTPHHWQKTAKIATLLLLPDRKFSAVPFRQVLFPSVIIPMLVVSPPNGAVNFVLSLPEPILKTVLLDKKHGTR